MSSVTHLNNNHLCKACGTICLHQELYRDHQPNHNQHEVDNLEAIVPSVNLILQTFDLPVVLQENTPKLGL